MSRIWILLLIVPVFIGFGWASDQTVKVKAADGIDTFTYSSDRLHREDLLRWVQLSPHISDTNNYLVPESLEMCLENSKEYLRCGSPGLIDSNFLTNAETNLSRIRKRIEDLQSSRYPPDLKLVTAYYAGLQNLSLSANARRLAFLKSWDVQELRKPIGDLNPAQLCPGVLTSIEAATKSGDKVQAYKIATHDWSNCVVLPGRKQIGEFPAQAWEEFLQSRGVKESFTDETPDD